MQIWWSLWHLRRTNKKVWLGKIWMGRLVRWRYLYQDNCVLRPLNRLIRLPEVQSRFRAAALLNRTWGVLIFFRETAWTFSRCCCLLPHSLSLCGIASAPCCPTVSRGHWEGSSDPGSSQLWSRRGNVKYKGTISHSIFVYSLIDSFVYTTIEMWQAVLRRWSSVYQRSPSSAFMTFRLQSYLLPPKTPPPNPPLHLRSTPPPLHSSSVE